MKLIRVVFLSFFAICTGSGAFAKSVDVCRHGLDTKLDQTFTSDAPLAQALLELGEVSHFCFGLRALDARAFKQVLHVKSTGDSVKQILSSMLKELPGYNFFEYPSGVTLVGIVDSGLTNSLLDRRVATFDAPRASLQTISNALGMQLAVEIDPSITGFAGNYYPSPTEDLIGPIHENGKKVWELLNEITGQSKGALWISSVPDSDKKVDARALSLWKIIAYTTPPNQALAVIREVASRFESQQD